MAHRDTGDSGDPGALAAPSIQGGEPRGDHGGHGACAPRGARGSCNVGCYVGDLARRDAGDSGDPGTLAAPDDDADSGIKNLGNPRTSLQHSL